MSDDEYVYDTKDSLKSFTLKLVDLKKMWKWATREHKTPVMIVKFDEGYVARITIEREI